MTYESKLKQKTPEAQKSIPCSRLGSTISQWADNGPSDLIPSCLGWVIDKLMVKQKVIPLFF